MNITQDIKAKEVLTRDAGLGASSRHLCSGSLTLRGGKRKFGGIKGKF